MPKARTTRKIHFAKPQPADRLLFEHWVNSADGYMDTPLCIGGGEVIKHDAETNIQYWKIPNTSRKSIGGGSGAGFWRFRYEEGVLKKSLEGVVIAEDENFSFIEAMATPYLYDSYLVDLKNFCTTNLSWFS